MIQEVQEYVQEAAMHMASSNGYLQTNLSAPDKVTTGTQHFIQLQSFEISKW
jgi:hypothetical protein